MKKILPSNPIVFLAPWLEHSNELRTKVTVGVIYSKVLK
jgi:hypothetical protein